MAFTWTFDAPSGVYKSHALSKKLYEAGLAETHFLEFVRPVEGFGRKRGDTITLVRIAAGSVAEPASAVLNESQRIPEDTYSLSTVAITVSEYGRAVPYTSLAEDLSEFDIENPIQSRLMEQQKLVMDSAVAAAMNAAKVCYVPTGAAAGTFSTNGTPAASATANWNVYHIETISDYMYDTLFVPPYSGDDYVAIVRTLGIRGIMRDPAWQQWKIYTTPEAKANGEVGRIENMRFVKTNHNNALGKVGTSSVLGQGVVFGKDATAMAEVITPELRAAIPGDFGRSKSVAWYGLLAFGNIWDTGNAGEAKIVRVTST